MNKNTIRVHVLWLVIISVGGCASTQPAAEKERVPAARPQPQGVAFELLSAGAMCGYEQPQQVVVRNAEEWSTLWDKTFAPIGDNAAPAVNFEQDMVVALFMGTKPSGGYAVEVAAVTESTAEVLVHIQENAPPPGSRVTMALTKPFCIVRLRNTDKPVHFRMTSNTQP